MSMLTGFTPLFQLWSTLAAASLFGAAVFLTRAKRRKTIAALMATLIFTVLNVVWDVAAHKAGWWSYPSQSRPFLPLPVYFAQDLVWGGAFGLIGWRIQRRFGSYGLAAYVLVISALRDFTIASRTKAISFGAGRAPVFADFACWLSLLLIAQVTIRLVGGPSTCEGLARTLPISDGKN